MKRAKRFGVRQLAAALASARLLALVVNAASEPEASFSDQAYLTGEPIVRGFANIVL